MTTRKAARIINAIKCSMVTTPEEHEALTIAERVLWEAEPIKQGRWIPCSERLPEYITSVLVQLTRTGDIFIGALVPNVDGTYTMWDLPNFSSYICLEDVIAWMPLPEPYKMDEVKE